ncbi:Cytoplasmic tRNA 2-thiolation protein 2 [[Candida] zeylanoides]
MAALEYVSDGSCSRCDRDAVLVTRKERFCKPCFVRFVRGKQRKSMPDEAYKVKYAAGAAPTRVLLALSMGHSSLVLLDVLASLLLEQSDQHRGRRGFELVVLNIDEHELARLDKCARQAMPRLQAFFAPIEFECRVLSVNSYVLDALSVRKIRLYPDFRATMQSLGDTPTLKQLLAACPNRSAAEDLATIVYEELAMQTAYVEGCSTVLYGHNMTRLANEIIALTVKGRGDAIHTKVVDREASYRGRSIKVVFPLRDVLQCEIDAYARLMELEQFAAHTTRPRATVNRNMTIRDLTTNYFRQLDATGYASTASTVVKTGEKLGPPRSYGEASSRCQICGIAIHQDPQSWLRRITVNEAAPVSTSEEQANLELYRQMSLPSGGDSEAQTTDVRLCYGCTVTFGSIQADGFAWPIRRDHEDAQILNEYILTDDEDEIN